MDNIQLQLLLDIKGFAAGIKNAMQMLQNFSKQAAGLLNIKAVNFNTKPIDDLNAKNTALQQSLAAASTGANELSNSNKILASSSSAAAVQQVAFKDKLAQTGQQLMGVMLLFRGLQMTIGDWVRSAENAEIANAKLANGLKNVGEGSAAFRDLQNQAVELRDVTPFSGSEIKNAQSMLTTFKKSSEEIKILIPRILDLSAAYMQSGDSSMDLQRVAVMLGKVNEETISSLRRVGVAFNKEEEEKLKSLQGTEQAVFLSQILDSNFRGMAQTVGETAAGKMKIFQNNIGALKVSMGSIISEGSRPFLAAFTAIIKVIDSAPQSIKGGILAFAAFAIAIKVLGTSFSPTQRIFTAFTVIVLALPAPLRLVAGAVVVLGVAVWALNGGLAATSVAIAGINLSLGGLPMLLGLLATGIVAIVTGITGSSQSAEEKLKAIDDSIADYTNRINDASNANKNLQNVYDYLNNNIEHSDAATQAYNSSLENLKNTYPDVYNKAKNFESGQKDLNKTIEDAIAKNEKLIAINQKAFVADLLNKYDLAVEQQKEKNKELEKEIQLRNQLQAKVNSGGEYVSNGKEGFFNKYDDKELQMYNEQLDKMNVKINDGTTQYSLQTKEIQDNIIQLKGLGGTHEQVSENIKSYLQGVILRIGDSKIEAQAFEDAINNLGDSGKTSLDDIKNHTPQVIDGLGKGNISAAAFTDSILHLGDAGNRTFTDMKNNLPQIVQALINVKNAADDVNASLSMTGWEESMNKKIKDIKENVKNPKDNSQLKSAVDAAKKEALDVKAYSDANKLIDKAVQDILSPQKTSRSSRSSSSSHNQEIDEVQEQIKAWQQALKFYYADAEIKEKLSQQGIAAGKSEIEVQNDLSEFLRSHVNLTAAQISQLSDFSDEIHKIKEDFDFKPRSMTTYLEDYMKGAYKKWQDQSARYRSTESWEVRSVKELEKALKMYNDRVELTGSLTQENIDYMEKYIGSQIKVAANEADQIALEQKIVSLEQKRNDLIQKRIEAEDLLIHISADANSGNPFFSAFFTEDTEGFIKKYNDILANHDKTAAEIKDNLKNGFLTDNEADIAHLENNIDSRKQIQKLVYQQIRNGISSAVSGVQQIADILNIGANTFVGKLISGLQFAVQLASSIVSTINSVLSIVSAVTKFSASPALGFASGGSVPGSGNSDSVNAMLTPGEFIISQPNVRSLTQKFGQGFLPWLNGGTLFSHLANKYAPGGLVTVPHSANTVIHEPYILSTEIKGQDLNVVLTRAKNYQKSRLI